MHQTFNEKNFQEICNELAVKDIHFKKIIDEHAYPPVWTRPNNFSSLIHIILEQQVSLASAKAAFVKLKKKTGGITPAKLLALSDAELRECYFSRQKTIYARALGNGIDFKRNLPEKTSNKR
jgi:DNA-3-methyladenine glycosylase II